MDTILEVLRVGGGSCGGRKWPDEVKARIVAATLLAGATVRSVARWHGLLANHVSTAVSCGKGVAGIACARGSGGVCNLNGWVDHSGSVH
ncbi:transposase [Ochrobactrum sp. EDr1-4]|uniref:transposase n=1 Tax=Ochrobactrum sp. EDr1-4 TaxID=3368622 RepID=UPI003BA2EDAC